MRKPKLRKLMPYQTIKELRRLGSRNGHPLFYISAIFNKHRDKDCLIDVGKYDVIKKALSRKGGVK